MYFSKSILFNTGLAGGLMDEMDYQPFGSISYQYNSR